MQPRSQAPTHLSYTQKCKGWGKCGKNHVCGNLRIPFPRAVKIRCGTHRYRISAFASASVWVNSSRRRKYVCASRVSYRIRIIYRIRVSTAQYRLVIFLGFACTDLNGGRSRGPVLRARRWPRVWWGLPIDDFLLLIGTMDVWEPNSERFKGLAR